MQPDFMKGHMRSFMPRDFDNASNQVAVQRIVCKPLVKLVKLCFILRSDGVYLALQRLYFILCPDAVLVLHLHSEWLACS